MKQPVAIIFTILFCLKPMAQAEVCQDSRNDIGWRLTGRAAQNLIEQKFFVQSEHKNFYLSCLEQNGNLRSEAKEALMTAIFQQIDIARYPKNDFSSSEKLELAKAVISASEAFGLDVFTLTGLLQVESNFDLDEISPRGAKGLTQLTKIAVREASDQLGLGGEEVSNLEVAAPLKSNVERYFEIQNGDAGDYFKWLQKAGARRGKTSQHLEIVKSDLHKSIVTGALVLRIYAAMQNGLAGGLARYNGSAPLHTGEPSKVRNRYARYVLGKGEQVFKRMPRGFACGDSKTLSESESMFVETADARLEIEGLSSTPAVYYPSKCQEKGAIDI